jgi:MFS family permease
VTPVPRSFYAAAFLTGVAYANVAVALPLYAIMLGRSASFAGGLLAAHTLAVAFGAVGSTPVLGRLGGRNTLAAGLAVSAIGQAVLLAPLGTTGLVSGATLQGAGMGLFWVGTQAMLGRRSGAEGSERGFVNQYAVYIVGTIAGSAATGLADGALRAVGASNVASIRLTFALGLVAAAVALALRPPVRRRAADEPRSVRFTADLPRRGFAVQSPDLLLVAALGLVLQLAPVILETSYAYSPLAIGMVMGGVAAAKIVGSFAAGGLARAAGGSRAAFTMLAGASALTAFLIVADAAGVFVVLLLVVTLLAVGVWPVIVDAALARIEPDLRGGMAVAWNVREYVVIAAASATGGWILDAFGSPRLLFLLAAAFLAASAASAATVLRRPVHAPEPA